MAILILSSQYAKNVCSNNVGKVKRLQICSTLTLKVGGETLLVHYRHLSCDVVKLH